MAGPEVYGNCNAPPAVTYSAILYALRCLVNRDIPLNQGCLAPVSVTLPKGSILCPSDDAGVCGGNTLTSQRVTDVVLCAFKAAAASQVFNIVIPPSFAKPRWKHLSFNTSNLGL